MQITTLTGDHRLLDAIRSRHAERDQQREGGLHLSTIVNDILKCLYPKEFDRPQDGSDATQGADTRQMYFELGGALEDVLADALVRRLPTWVKPRPQARDAVWCSPDGWIARSKTIDEIKATWKSARDFPASPKFYGYQIQTLAYMYVWGATRGRIHVTHLNGDWRPPVPWPPVTYVLRPTARELADNWRMLLQHAADRGWRS